MSAEAGEGSKQEDKEDRPFEQTCNCRN